MSKSITEAAQAVTQISVSNKQQSVGMDQIATAMEGIRSAALQNADGIQQVERAAQRLRELAQTFAMLTDTPGQTGDHETPTNGFVGSFFSPILQPPRRASLGPLE